MLFAYQYVPHSMGKMHEFVSYIFHDVWCKALSTRPYNLNLFNGRPELKKLMLAFDYSDAKGADFFSSHVERIYGLFAQLSLAEVTQFQAWYLANNDIERVCANDPAVELARYADFQADFPELCTELKRFFNGLYSNDVLGLSAVKRIIGDIDDHYNEFATVNDLGKCPFCGITDMHGVYHEYREAYDHYLPKAFYPFNTINFRNLAPACHHCNSTYKTTKDPAFTPKDKVNNGIRRKAFYPYSATPQKIDISVNINAANVDNLLPDDIDFTFGPASVNEEIETWKDVYGIENRYKAKCSCKSDGKYWLIQMLDEKGRSKLTPAEKLQELKDNTEDYPLADNNFLKKAFLEACDDAGLFEDTEQ